MSRQQPAALLLLLQQHSCQAALRQQCFARTHAALPCLLVLLLLHELQQQRSCGGGVRGVKTHYELAAVTQHIKTCLRYYLVVFDSE